MELEKLKERLKILLHGQGKPNVEFHNGWMECINNLDMLLKEELEQKQNVEIEKMHKTTHRIAKKKGEVKK